MKRILLNTVLIYANSENVKSVIPESWHKRILETVTLSDKINSSSGSNLTGYDDFTPSWYTVEGTNILLGMWTRVLIIFYVFTMRYNIPRLCRAYDQKWKKNRAITRKLTHKKYI